MARGSKPGERRGGRTKGQPNRKNRETIAKAEALGITPLEVMLEAMMAHYRLGNLDEAALKAKEAAPYVHPKLASVEQKNTGEITVHSGVDRPPRETRDEWLARRQREAQSH